MLSAHSDPRSAPLQVAPDEKVAKDASLQVIRAWDHTLQLVGSSLSNFMPSKLSSRLLAPGELRYLVPSEPWADYDVPVGTPWLRSCIKQTRTGEKRFEVPAKWPSGPPVLFLNTDECGTNLAPWQFLQGALGARVVMVRDAAHRHWRDFRLALGEVDLWTEVLEKMHVMGIKHGPWHSQSWWRQMTESVDLHMRKANSADPLFMALFPKLAEEVGVQERCEPGSQDEVNFVWAKLRAAKCFKIKGSRCTLTRWFEYLEHYKAFDSEYWANMYQLCLMLHYTGLYKSIYDMPIWDAEKAPESVAPLPVVARAGKRQSMVVSAAEENMAATRAKCKNACEMAARILGDPGSQRRGRIIVEVGTPLYSAFSKELAACADPAATRKFHMLYSRFAYSFVFHRVWSRLSDSKSLLRMQFRFDCEDVAHYQRAAGGAGGGRSASSSSSSSQPQVIAPVALLPSDDADQPFAQLLWSLCCRTVKHRGMSMSHYRDIPPGIFFGLASTDAQSRHCALQSAKEAWEVLCAVEGARHEDVEVDRIVRSIGFLHNTVCREVLVLLAQHAFQAIVPGVSTIVEALLDGFCQSVVIERAFQKMQDIKRLSKNSRTARVKRYYQPHSSALLAEMGRTEVQPFTGELPGDVPRRIPSKAFEAEGGEDSVDSALLEQIKSSSRTDYPSTSAQGLQVQVAAWRLLCSAVAEGKLADLGNTWQALLLPPDSIVMECATSRFSILLKACVYGVLLWPAQRFQCNGRTIFRPSAAEGSAVSWATVWQADQWKVFPTAIVPPQVLKALSGKAPGAPVGICAVQTGEPLPPEVASAKTGFAALPEIYLDKLIREVGLLDGMEHGQKPRGILPKVELLVKHYIPNCSEEALATILKDRAGLGRRRRASLLLTGNNLDHAEGCMDKDDKLAAKEYKQNSYIPQVVLKTATVEFMAARKLIPQEEAVALLRDLSVQAQPKAAAKTKSKARAAPVTLKEVWSWTEQHLKQSIPKGKGITIQEVNNVHNKQWTGRYLGAGSRSRTFWDEPSRVAAAKHVFSWLWEMHRVKNPSEPCPYNLQEVLAF